MSDELGFNKIAGAVLATALVFMVVREIAHAAYHPHQPDVPAYGAEILEAAKAAAAAGNVDEAPLPFPQADWVTAMNFEQGEKISLKCVACHTFEKGGATVTGPNLYNIVGSASASNTAFKYSEAMANIDVTWDFETLNAYLEKPTRYVKGTNMVFAGLKKPEQRAAMIEYMRTFSDSPLPRPEPAALIEELATGVIVESEEVIDGESVETLIPDVPEQE